MPESAERRSAIEIPDLLADSRTQVDAGITATCQRCGAECSPQRRRQWGLSCNCLATAGIGTSGEGAREG